MLEIEIVESNIIEGGVEIFARAFNDAGQIGFGDGTVDIERFRIFNPPVLVTDENGDITRITPADEEFGIAEHVSRHREDAEEAVLQSLEHTIKAIAKFGDVAIVQGKRGNTTTTLYSTAGGDGAITSGNDANWTTVRNGTALSAASADSTRNVYTDNAYYIRRLYFPFDTSSITDTDTLDSATISLYSTTGSSDAGYSVGIIRGSQAADTTLATSDWAPVDFTRIATDKTIASIISGGSKYYDWTLNATGEAHVDFTGDSDFILAMDRDIDDSAHASGTTSYMTFFMADQTGTANDPKLVVEHSAAATNAVKSINGLSNV